MAAKTASVSGYTDQSATFGGAGAAATDDTITINDGVTLTLRANTSLSLGDSASPSTPAIRTASTGGTGVFVMEAGSSLTIRANVQQGNATWTVADGVTITANNSTALTWQIGDNHNQANAKLTITGASGSRVTINGAGGGSYLRFTDGGFLRGGKLDAQYADFRSVGNASNSGFQFWLSSSGNTFSLRNCTLDASCGVLDGTSAAHADAVFRVEDCVFNATGQNIGPALFTNAISGGTYSIQRNYLAGSLGNSSNGGRWRDATIKDNVILGGIYSVGSNAENWASGSGNNLIRLPFANGVEMPSASLTQANYWHVHSPAGQLTNIRWLYPRTGGDSEISGQLLEPGDTDSTGDLIPAASPGSARSCSVKHDLVTLNASGAHAGQFVSCLGNANMTLPAIDHNTFPATAATGESGAISYGESYAGRADMIGSIGSNLVWSPSAGGGYVFQRRSQATQQDGCSAANVRNNGKFNLSTGDYGVGYDDTAGSGMYSSGSPGANDVVFGSDPFTDRTRRLSTYAVEFAGASSGDTYSNKCAAAYSYLAADPAVRIPHLIAWVRAGFAPNTASALAAHDNVSPSNGWIGALEGSVPTPAFVLCGQEF